MPDSGARRATQPVRRPPIPFERKEFACVKKGYKEHYGPPKNFGYKTKY